MVAAAAAAEAAAASVRAAEQLQKEPRAETVGFTGGGDSKGWWKYRKRKL